MLPVTVCVSSRKGTFRGGDGRECLRNRRPCSKDGKFGENLGKLEAPPTVALRSETFTRNRYRQLPTSSSFPTILYNVVSTVKMPAPSTTS